MSIEKNTNLAQVIAKIYYAFTYEIASVNAGSSDFHKTVTFKSGYNWKLIFFTSGSADLKETPNKSDAGIAYKQKLNLFFPGEDESNTQLFNDLNQKPLVLKIVYSSGQIKLMGSLLSPAELNEELSVSKKTGHSISVESVSIDKIPYLE